MVKKINQEKTKMVNQGAGFNWGISQGVVGDHQFLA